MSIHVMSWVFRHSESTLGDRLVLLVLADHAKEDGTEAWPSVDTIASEARMSRRGVQYALRRLEDEAMIERTGYSANKTAVFRVVMGGEVSAPPGAHTTTGGGEAVAPKPSKEPSVCAPSPPNGVEEAHTRNVDPVEAVFGAWVLATDTQRAVLDPKRRRLIGRWLTAYPVDDLVDAVRGWSNLPFYRGENDRGEVYNSLEMLLRDAGHIEKFRDAARGAIGRGPEDRATRLAREAHERARALEEEGR